MAEKDRKVLGKGIGAIFERDDKDISKLLDDIQNGSEQIPGHKATEVNISEIRPNPYQPRKEFDEKALNELAESIKIHGVFIPILIRKSVGGYELIAGERRLRASKLAGLETIPAIEVEFSDEEMMEVSLLENIQREDLSPIEEASAYESLIKRLGYTQEQLAMRIGKSREYCANMLRLLKLPHEVQNMVNNKELTMGHVRPLLALENEEEMVNIAKKILQEKLSVRAVEEYIRELTGKQKGSQSKLPLDKDPHIRDLENRLSSKLGTQVEISTKAINIRYSGIDDLNRLLEELNLIEEE